MSINQAIYTAMYLLFLALFGFIITVFNTSVAVTSISFTFFVVVTVIYTSKFGFGFFSIPVVFVIFFSLFVGGRFLGCSLSIFNDFSVCPLNYQTMFQQERMTQTYLKVEQANYILHYIIIWVSIYILGCCFFFSRIKNKSSSALNYINLSSSSFKLRAVNVLLIFSLVSMLIFRFQDISAVLKGGYLALYMRGDESYFFSVLKNIVFIFFITTFSISFSENKKIPYLYIIIFLAFLDIIVGQRGAFFSKVVLLIATSQRMREISLLRAFTLLLFIFIALNWIMNFSLRGNSETEYYFNIFDLVGRLLFSQGTTIGIIGFTIFDVESIPARLSIKSFVPFTNAIFSAFGGDIEFYERSIGQYISYQANSKAYELGGGLGSSIISESHLIFGFYGSILFVIVLAFFTALIETKKFNSAFGCFIWLNVIYVIPMLPRSGISNLMVPLFIALIFYLLYRINFFKRYI